MTGRRSVLYPLLILSSVGAFAGWSPASAAGTTCFPVLMELTDPRALALGGAAVSEVGAAELALLNPASAAGDGLCLNANYASHMVDMSSGRLYISYPLSRDFIAGSYLSIFDYGSIKVAGDASDAGESFDAAEYVLAGYVSGRLAGRLTWGGAMKFVWGHLKGSGASGGAVDIGVTYDPDWQRFRFGAALRNVGAQFNGYGPDRFPLPTQLTVGGSRRLLHLPMTLNLALELCHKGEGSWETEFLPGNPGLSLAASAELDIASVEDGEPMQLRLGYRSIGEGLRVGHRLDLLAGFSFGIGLPVRSLRADYTYAPMGALGDVHRLGITGRFSLQP